MQQFLSKFGQWLRSKPIWALAAFLIVFFGLLAVGIAALSLDRASAPPTSEGEEATLETGDENFPTDEGMDGQTTEEGGEVFPTEGDEFLGDLTLEVTGSGAFNRQTGTFNPTRSRTPSGSGTPVPTGRAGSGTPTRTRTTYNFPSSTYRPPTATTYRYNTNTPYPTWTLRPTFTRTSSPTAPTVTEKNTVESNVWQTSVNNPSFTWTGSTGATYYVYWGTSAVGSYPYTVQTATTFTPAPLSGPAVYYLRMQTRSAAGAYSAWTTLFIFRYAGVAIEAGGAKNGVWQYAVSNPKFTWTAVTGVTSYEVYWGTDENGKTVTDTVNSALYDPPLMAEGAYYLRLRLNGNDPWLTFFTYRYDSTPPTQPTSIVETHGIPNGGWQNTSFDTSFTWSGADDALGGVGGYLLYWGDDPAGTSPTYYRSSTNAAFNPAAVAVSGSYYLRMRTIDAAGNMSDWKTMFTLLFEDTLPSAPGAAVETGGALPNIWQKTVSSPKFTWTASSDTPSGIAGYDIYWGPSPDGTTITASSATAAYTPAPLTGEGTYHLRVRARDNAGNLSVWTNSFIFKYDAAPPGAVPAPITETSGIQSGVCQPNKDAAFAWNPPPEAGSGMKGYNIYWGEDPNGTAATFNAARAFDPPAVLAGSRTYLRVQPLDLLDNLGAWQTIFTLCQADAAVTLPANTAGGLNLAAAGKPTLTVTFAAPAYAQDLMLRLWRPESYPPAGAGLAYLDQPFVFAAATLADPPYAAPFANPYELKIGTTAPPNEASLKLYEWDGSAWQEVLGAVLDTAAHTLTANLDHPGEFCVMGTP